MNIKKLLLQSLGFTLFFCFAQGAWALSCYKGSGLSAWSGKERTQTEAISQPVLVPMGVTAAGTTLWRSQTYSATFTCFDTESRGGESAYAYWDPQSQISTIDPSIQVGVTINGVDYSLVKGQRLLLGPGTAAPVSTQNCRNIGITSSTKTCATPQTITVKYGIFVKSTNSNPPASGQISNSGTYSVFQIDGSGGLNSVKDSNFNLYLTGLNNIKFVQCNPEVTVEGTNGNTVDFGKIVPQASYLNQIVKLRTFNIKADLSKTDTGGVCNGNVLVASFLATNSQNNNTILPTGRSDIGIQLFQHNGTTPLNFLTPYDLSTINNGVASNTFDAGVIQLSASPALGQFNATATVEVTFK
ncbi:fimbrial protein [Acinetobacter oleivorans]|uniref:fimbrial protein n=1 Tax=Acinetobacter oleivorans TaxID=1148157 RepID=UPI001CD5A369|nr:fimbrial protein [Acinetobacter oleivorans]